MNEIKFNTEYTNARTIEGSVDTDISDQIHDAVVEGVTNCGGYDVDIQGSDGEEVAVVASGTVYVHVDAEYLIEQDLEDTHDVDVMDGTITDWEIDANRYGEVEINYTFEVGEEVEHDSVSDFDEFVADCRVLLVNVGHLPELRAKLLRILRLAVGQEFIDNALEA